MKVAICAPSPIQHEIPLYQEFAKAEAMEVTVLYFSDIGVKSFSSFGMKNITYGIPMLEGYSFQFIKNISPFKSFRLRFFNPGIVEALKQGNYDAVILYGYYSATHQMVLNYCRKHKVTVYLRAEGESVQPVSQIKKWVRRMALPGVFKKFDYFLALCQANQSHYLEYGVKPEQVKFVAQTVNDVFFAEYDPSNFTGLKNKYGLKEDEIIFVYGSKQRPEKRPMDAVKAFCEIPASAKAKLLMLSDGPLKKECEAYALEHDKLNRIVFTGYIEFTEMRDLFGLSDVLLITSFETIGATLYQALFSGLAILTSDMVPGWLDVVTPGVNGLIYRGGWIEALVKSIESLTSNRDLVMSMKESSKTISHQYSTKAITKKLVEAILENKS